MYKLKIDKLVPVPVDLSKLRDLIKNDVIAALVKKTDFDDKLKNLNKKSYLK